MNKLLKSILLCLVLTCTHKAGAQTQVTYYTSMGNFNAMLTDTLTPRTVDSFLARVAHKFYDGLIFHRIIDSFMIQGGDPLGTGFGGPGYTTPDEFVPSLKNIPGALAMANSGPNTNGSQFYINLATNAWLDNHYTVFGMVTSNFTVVQNIGHVPTNISDKPLTDVVIDSIRVTVPHNAAVHNVKGSISYAMYPNPCENSATIILPATATTVEILNIQGQTVYSNVATGQLNINLQQQPSGMYIVRATNEYGVSEQKLMLQH